MILSNVSGQPRQRKTRNFASLRFEVLLAVRAMPANIPSEAEMSKGDLWVFGYGSLIWRPRFEFIEQAPARLNGQHPPHFLKSFHPPRTPRKPRLAPRLHPVRCTPP